MRGEPAGGREQAWGKSERFCPNRYLTELAGGFFHGFFYLRFSEIMQLFGFYAKLDLIVPCPIYKLGFSRIQVLPLGIIGVTSIKWLFFNRIFNIFQ